MATAWSRIIGIIIGMFFSRESSFATRDSKRKNRTEPVGSGARVGMSGLISGYRDMLQPADLPRYCAKI